MQLPEHVYNTLVQLCDAYPHTVVQNEYHIGEILNAVAWTHRAEGWGLSRKTGGKHIDSPVGPIAEDILQLPDGNHFDVLGGIDVGQPLRPGRANSIGIINLRDRPWVAPNDHKPAWLSTPIVDTPKPAPAVCNFQKTECQCKATEEVKGLSDAVHSLVDQLRTDIDQLRKDVQAIKLPECRFKFRW